MKTKFVEEQFKTSEILKSAIYNPDTDTYFLPKRTTIKLEQGKAYIVELDDILLQENGDYVLQFNWNKGKTPTEKYYKIDVINIIGKMIQVVGIAYDWENKIDLNSFWNGYLPKERLKVLEVL